jgi:sialic acid synthase SpsE
MKNEIKKFKIGNKEVGDGCPCYIISEIGNNHGANKDTAKKMIKASADAGADAVKFQTFKTLDIVNPNVPANAYPGWDVSDKFEYWYQFVETLEMPYEWYDELISYTRSLGLAFISTPASFEAVEFLGSKKVDAVKVASMDLNNIPLLKEIEKLGLPVILSTGMSTIDEIEEAVAVFKKSPLAILHCVSDYPLKSEDAGLLNIKMLRERFKIPVGFSNHALGYDLDIVAAALSASIIEKHFTLDRSDTKTAEHHFSMQPEEMKEMVEKVRMIKKALGGGDRKMNANESKNRQLARRSITAAKEILKGQAISKSDLTFIRPGTGLAPKYLDDVVGKKTKRTIKPYELIERGDLE